MNLAFLAKLEWRMLQDENSLWVKVLSGKYMHTMVKLECVQPKHGSSNAQQGIVKATHFLSPGV